jgi:hypothetical protein
LSSVSGREAGALTVSIGDFNDYCSGRPASTGGER